MAVAAAPGMGGGRSHRPLIAGLVLIGVAGAIWLAVSLSHHSATQPSGADAAQQMVSNRYQAGQVSFVEVATAQASAYAARRALVQAASQRQAAAVALIQALGGGWKGL